jgi:exosortase D (VPLPA-CTERM-specific)
MNSVQIWRNGNSVWLAFLVSALFLGFIYYGGLSYMVEIWGRQEEYSHGYLIPFISLFFIWQKKNELEKLPFAGSWAGVLILLLGVGLFILGELSALYIIVQYSFLVSLFGLVLAWLGWRGVKVIWVPLLFLVFMIPLPNFLYQGLSAQLQLISSEIGVWVIRLFGVSVFLEGNVIDLGSYKLQVVEACSGLRYLFPLMTLGFMVAYIYKAAFWKRAVIFLSTIPITVLMNSFRIGVIGVLVEYYGQSMAEGFLHDFEGWAVFMASLGVLLVEMLILTRIGKQRESLHDVFGIYFPEPSPEGAQVERRKVPVTLMASLVILGAAALLAQSLGNREEYSPARKEFASFPLTIGEWKGQQPDKLEKIYLDILKLDDYVITDYVGPDGRNVNFYVAYYASQTKGESAHSPRSCLPGGGWKIASLQQKTLDATSAGKPVDVNRVVIKRGDYTQLVYYWFQGRGRTITNEYLVKWYLFWDALTRKRTDGALVRLTTMVTPTEDLESAERRLGDFARQMSSTLDEYVPN